MALITLPFTVTGQQLEFTQPVLAEHAVGSIGATFAFSDEWSTLTTRTYPSCARASRRLL